MSISSDFNDFIFGRVCGDTYSYGMNRIGLELQSHLEDVITDDAGDVRGRYILPETFVGFEGHFPGNPVLPGIVTIQLVLELMAKQKAMPLRLCAISQAKFFHVISPEDRVDVCCRLQEREDGNFRVNGDVTCNNERAASLVLIVSEEKD